MAASAEDAPVADAALFDVATSDGKVGPVADGLDELSEHLGGMLQVGVHDGEDFAAGGLPTPDDGGGESGFLRAADDTDPGNCF